MLLGHPNPNFHNSFSEVQKQVCRPIQICGRKGHEASRGGALAALNNLSNYIVEEPRENDFVFFYCFLFLIIFVHCLENKK